MEGEGTSAADRETRKKAKVKFQMINKEKGKGKDSKDYSWLNIKCKSSTQVDYNEEKSGVKKKGDEGSDGEIQEVIFHLTGQNLSIGSPSAGEGG